MFRAQFDVIRHNKKTAQPVAGWAAFNVIGRLVEVEANAKEETNIVIL